MIFGYDNTLRKETGLNITIKHSLESHCHMLLTGASGSGKSYALLYLLGMLLKENKYIVVYFCDFKNSTDFSFMENYPYYYAGNDCYKGIMDYYRVFTNARMSRDNTCRHVLICDEYPSLINYLQMQDKVNKTKYANEVLSAISEILMLGRGIKFGIWIVTQRADSSLFANGCRDNFMVIIGLGRMSREQKGMIFTGEDIPDTICKQGEGLLLADGYALTEVKYPFIEDMEYWKHQICFLLMSGSGA